MRQPRRSNVDTALLFGITALIIVESWATAALGITPGRLQTTVVDWLLMCLPYLLLRLLDDFSGVDRRLLQLATGGLVLAVISLAIWPGPHLPALVTLYAVAYFVILSIYVATEFVRAARHSSGITRRRMSAVALGSLCLGLVILLAGFESAVPDKPRAVLAVVADMFSLGAGMAYFIGFAPPHWLRRTWQEPELRAFLSRAASLPRLPDTASIVRALEHGAASSLGTGRAVIGLWSDSVDKLEFPRDDTPTADAPLVDSFAQRAFETQQPIFSSDAMRESPADAPLYRLHRVNSVLSVPITAGTTRLGVLSIYAVRAPIFAEDDLTLAQLLADQAAVILESRVLIDEATRVQAREEATRLKDDFLSAAAHDLKTPLTALIAQAQLMERRAQRNPGTPADLEGIQRMVRESQRLKRLVTDLLDIGRVEQGNLLGLREWVELEPLVREVCERHSSPRHPCLAEIVGNVAGNYDPVRIRQLVDNLVENAVKYSPEGGEVLVKAWREHDLVYLTVSDQGIGIPAGDLPFLFDRFHRGTNVDDRRFAGMGLGLFICRSIADQHGGRLWATSPGSQGGSTFHVALPVSVAADEPAVLPTNLPSLTRPRESA